MALSSVVFRDGEHFFEELSKEYIVHSNGLFILGPSGVGKTYFCNSQKEPHWIDGDYLWESANAHPDPKYKYWTQGLDVIERIEQRSDVITSEAKHKGFWIIGGSNNWLKPDAIVIPDWDTHVKYIKDREENHYDGGATLDALDQVKSHIEFIKHWNKENRVPIFKTIQGAVDSLTKSGLR